MIRKDWTPDDDAASRSRHLRCGMPGILTFLTGRNLPTIWQLGTEAPSIINERTIRDFTRVVEQTEHERAAQQSRNIKAEIERLDRLFEDR